jgi:glycosyltransferase involved in cell wall biosynthesis
MRIVWVSFAPLRKTPAGLTSDLASVRYRLTLPAAALPGSKVTHLASGANRRTLLERFAGADVVVFGKLFDAAFAEPVLEVIAALRGRGVKVIADYSDDNFAHPALGAAYRALANAADLLVASTEGLAEVLRAEAAAPVHVVTDPVEGRRGEPRTATRRPVQLLWFGHPLNLDTLRFGLPQIRQEFSLTLVSAPGSGAEAAGHRFRPWTPSAVFEELRECDAVIIPSDPHNPRKVVKSPNRFTESLWAGRFVIAHPLPSYQPLAGYGWVGDDLGDGLAWLLENPEAAAARVRAGQRAVEEQFSPQAVGRAWQAAIAAL